MNALITHKEKLVGGITIVSRIKDTIVAHKGLEVEPVLGMTLDPASPDISIQIFRDDLCHVYDSLNGIATPTCACCDCAIGVDLGVLLEGIFPAFLKVDEGLPAPVLGDGIGKVCQ